MKRTRPQKKLTIESVKQASLRSYVRNEIKKIMEQDGEEDSDTDSEEDTPPAGLGRDLEQITRQFITKIKQSTEELSSEDLVEIVSDVLKAFEDTSEARLSVLKKIKAAIVY